MFDDKILFMGGAAVGGYFVGSALSKTKNAKTNQEEEIMWPKIVGPIVGSVAGLWAYDYTGPIIRQSFNTLYPFNAVVEGPADDGLPILDPNPDSPAKAVLQIAGAITMAVLLGPVMPIETKAVAYILSAILGDIAGVFAYTLTKGLIDSILSALNPA